MPIYISRTNDNIISILMVMIILLIGREIWEGDLQRGQETHGSITLIWISGRWVVMLEIVCILPKIGILSFLKSAS